MPKFIGEALPQAIIRLKEHRNEKIRSCVNILFDCFMETATVRPETLLPSIAKPKPTDKVLMEAIDRNVT